jgi:hypothetical protein
VAEVVHAAPWEIAREERWEGVIAKRRDSVYEHRRSPHWLKMKIEASQELVVGGFTDPQGSRVGLGALLVGYFEGIDSERGLEWRCADSLSLREFLRLGERERVPDHSWLSRTRSRLPIEVHDTVFTWVLERLAEQA